MSIEKLNLKIKRNKDKHIGFRVDKIDGKDDNLKVIDVEIDSLAAELGLRVNDIIVKINGKEFKLTKKDWISEINKSKCSSIQIHVEREREIPATMATSIVTTASAPCSESNEASPVVNHNFIPNDSNEQSDSISDNSYHQNTSSSMTKLEFSRILADGYIPESNLKDYIQESTSPGPIEKNHQFNNLETSQFSNEPIRDDTSIKPTVTRKLAYKTTIHDPTNASGSRIRGSMEQLNSGPRVQIKQATNQYPTGVSTDNKVNYKLKKRTNPPDILNQNKLTKNISNTKIDVLNDSSNGFKKSISMSPTGFKEFSKSEDIQNNNGINSQSSSKDMLSPINDVDPVVQKPAIVSRKHTPIKFSIKILKFEKSIKRVTWKNFMLEKDLIGVLFTCEEINHSEMPNSSSVLDPRFTSSAMFFENWLQSNCASRFLLPIGMDPYCKDVLMAYGKKNIHVNFTKFDVQFMIDVESNRARLNDLLDLLQIENEEKQPIVTVENQKRKNTMPDLPRIDIRKTRPSKSNPELPKQNISQLVQNKKVKNVPLIMVLCAEIIEKLGIAEEGIYRKSGNVAARKRLEELVANEPVNEWVNCNDWLNLHTVANLMKRFLDKYKLLDSGTALKLAIIKSPDDLENHLERDDRIQSCRDMHYLLSTALSSRASFSERQEPNYSLDIFLYLINHLHHVSKHESKTRMNSLNLATCLMPNIVEEIPANTREKTTNDLPANNHHVMITEKMNKMMAFWIKHARFITEIMEERAEDKLLSRIKEFIDYISVHGDSTETSTTSFRPTAGSSARASIASDLNNSFNSINEKSDEKVFEEDSTQTITDIIQFYTSEPSDLIYPTEIQVPDSPDIQISNTQNDATKTGGIKSEKNNNLNRRSSSISPMNSRKWKDLVLPKQSIMRRSDGNKNKASIFPSSFRILSRSIKNVPLVVEICVKFVEKFGMKVEGIYRRSGSGIEIAELKKCVDTKDPTEWPSLLNSWKYLLNTCCLLKSVLKDMGLILKEAWLGISSQFSEVNNELTTEELRKTLLAAVYWLSILRLESVIKSKLTANKIQFICQKEIHEIALIKYDTLQYVVNHLKRVCDNCGSNKMNLHALCVCFMPVLLEDNITLSGDTIADMNNVMISTKKNHIILKTLLEHSEWIFQWGTSSENEFYDGRINRSLDEYLSQTKPEPSTAIIPDHCMINDDSSNNASFSSEDVMKLLTQILAESGQNDFIGARRRHSDGSTKDDFEPLINNLNDTLF